MSQELSTRNITTIEQAVLSWLTTYSLPLTVNNLQELSDGRVFSYVLEQLSNFTLVRPMSQAGGLMLQEKIRNVKTLQESIKRHLQSKLGRESTAVGNISVAQMCAGSKREIVKFLEIVIGTLMSSEAKNAFLKKVMQLSFEHQEVFMLLIKAGIALFPEEQPPNSSPSRARTLLQRIEQLQEILQQRQAQLVIERRRATDLEDSKKLLLQQLSSQKQQLAIVMEENEQLKSRPGQTDREAIRQIEQNALQQRLEAQKQAYEKKISKLQAENEQAENRIQQLRQLVKENRQLQKNCESATKRLVSLEQSVSVNYQILRDKDSTINALRDKHRNDQQKIIELEREIDELHEMSMINLNQTKSYKIEEYEQPSTYRERRALGKEMSEVVQELTAQNSRLISEMTQEQLKKEQEYEEIILKQRQRIKALEESVRRGLLDRSGKENNMNGINSTGKKKHKLIDNGMETVKMCGALQQQHRIEIAVLIEVLCELRQENDDLKELMRQEMALKAARKTEFKQRLEMMFPR